MQQMSQRWHMFIGLGEQLEDLGILRMLGVGDDVEIGDGRYHFEAGASFRKQ